jgi:hypothetical protein
MGEREGGKKERCTGRESEKDGQGQKNERKERGKRGIRGRKSERKERKRGEED